MAASARTFHLLLFGTPRAVRVELPQNADTHTQILAATRQLTEAVTGEAIRQTHERGHSVTCRAGCGACCRQIVRITTVEAQALAQLVEQMPEPRRSVIRGRFSEAMAKLRAGDIVAPAAAGERSRFSVHAPDLTDEEWTAFAGRYFAMQIACPFLEEESCSIYEHRPLICREYLVTSPVAHCQSLSDADIKSVPLSIQISERLIELARAADPATPATTTLVFSLEWAQVAAVVAGKSGRPAPVPDLGDPSSALQMLSLFCRTE